MSMLTVRGLLRYLVLFVIDLKTRRIEIAGIVRDPNGEWMQQVARNLIDACDGPVPPRTHAVPTQVGLVRARATGVGSDRPGIG
jgi:hypothetical protein